MSRILHYLGVLYVLIGALMITSSIGITTTEDDCEVCQMSQEVDKLKELLSSCKDELLEYKQKLSAQDGVESSSALSYLSSMFSGLTYPSKRSSPLHSTVNTFLQNLDIDAERSTNEIKDIHEVDVR